MNTVRILSLILASVICTVTLQAQTATFEGAWQGKLSVGATTLRIVINIKNDNGALSGTMDSPDQGVRGIPITSVSTHNDSVFFSIDAIKGSYTGHRSPQGVIAGQWKQSSISLPLELRREAIPEERHQQDPVKPYPYNEEEITFANAQADITLAGTLTTPRSGGPFPVVVLISGSGPQNRDCFILGHRPFLVIADYLTRQGFAVLRFDERGIGQSTGNYATATTQDFASDVRAAVEWLSTRRDIDPKRIGLLGHSEGGLVAPLVATHVPQVSYLVLLAAPGTTGKEILRTQAARLNRAAGMGSEMAAASAILQTKLQEAALQTTDSAELYSKVESILNTATGIEREFIAAQNLTARQQLPILLSPWFRFFLSYDPQPTLQKVSVPVLALNGDRDIQVAPDNLDAIAKALRAGGNTSVTTHVMPNLNHLFQTATTGLPAEYGSLKETFAPDALRIIGEWLSATAGK